jgi:hypothetical protein
MPQRDLDKLLAFAFGVVFCSVLLGVALIYQHPTPSMMFVVRVILSVAAAGVGAVIPGLLQVKTPYVRAGGALALAVIVFFFNPPALLSP